MNKALSVLLQDKSIQAIIKSAGSREEIVKAILEAATKRDIAVTEAEVTELLASMESKPRKMKLTDQDLLGVSGGMMAADSTTTKGRTFCLCPTKRINDANC